MARTVAEIQAQMVAAIAADPILSGLSSTSKRAIWNLFTNVFASALAIEEQLMDVFKAEIESLASSVPPGTAEWVQSKVLQFQYDPNNPQVVQLIDLIPQYPQVLSQDQIVTRCSVTTDLSGNVTIKVAKKDPPMALAAAELSALQDYIDTIGFAGITYTCTTANADQLYLAATIYYKGQYSAVIAANVITSLNTFLAGIPFNGDIQVSDIAATIKAVTGVEDVVLTNVGARSDGDPVSVSNLVNNAQVVNRLWNTVSGYIIGETTAGNTLSDTLNFVAQ
jgi:hypothetical protein